MVIMERKFQEVGVAKKEDKEGDLSLRSGCQEVFCDSRGSSFSEQFKWRQMGEP